MSGHHEDPVRKGYRFPAGVPATFQDDGHAVECVAVNLSRSGALLSGVFPVPGSGRLDVMLRTPSGGFSIQLPARIIRVDGDGASGESRLAIEFEDMDATRRDAIEVFLARLLESQPTTSLDGVKPGASPLDIKKALEAIPLTQKVTMAQKADAKQRELLRYDTHVAVLDSLIRNSNFALAEARALASSPYLQTGTIDMLANDPRFRNDDELRLTLATHPKVSPFTAERLTSALKPPEIRKLLARPGLSPSLRDKLLKKMVRGS
jgi:hypothetical protein